MRREIPYIGRRLRQGNLRCILAGEEPFVRVLCREITGRATGRNPATAGSDNDFARDRVDIRGTTRLGIRRAGGDVTVLPAAGGRTDYDAITALGVTRLGDGIRIVGIRIIGA